MTRQELIEYIRPIVESLSPYGENTGPAYADAEIETLLRTVLRKLADHEYVPEDVLERIISFYSILQNQSAIDNGHKPFQ